LVVVQPQVTALMAATAVLVVVRAGAAVLIQVVRQLLDKVMTAVLEITQPVLVVVRVLLVQAEPRVFLNRVALVHLLIHLGA
jgi:hypothetical protein